MHMPTNPSCLVHPPPIHSHRFFTEKLRKKIPEGGNQVAYVYIFFHFTNFDLQLSGKD